MPRRSERRTKNSPRSRNGHPNLGGMILFFILPAFTVFYLVFSDPCSPGIFSMGPNNDALSRACLAQLAQNRHQNSDASFFDISNFINSPLGDLALNFAGIDASSPKAQAAIKKYGHLIPADGKISEADLRRAPSELKSMCGPACREAVKSYMAKK